MGRDQTNTTSDTSRRSLLKIAALGSAAATLTALYPALGAAREIVSSTPDSDKQRPEVHYPAVQPFELDEITISDLQDGMKSGKFTARFLVEKYSSRIDDVDQRGPAINSVIEMNPDALWIAAALDQERKAKGPRGPLHGIPVLIKDNIDTADRMMKMCIRDRPSAASVPDEGIGSAFRQWQLGCERVRELSE